MIVIVKEAEDKLLQELKKCREDNPFQRCFYLPFSRTDIPRQKLFESFLRNLENIPNSYMAQVYFCQDHDVFILMQGFMQRHFTDFMKKFSQDLGEETIEKIGIVFEANTHWRKLEDLCTDKISAIKYTNEKQNKEKTMEAAGAAAMDMLKKMNSSLISTISSRRAQRQGRQPLVMIADDDQLSRTLAGNVLSGDYMVAFAQDGMSALENFIREAPDVLFLDIGLPDINGHEVLEILFQIDPEAYVIMFSGRKDEENIMRALDAGAQGFLGKPFTREKLYQHVQKSPFIDRNRKHEKISVDTMN